MGRLVSILLIVLVTAGCERGQHTLGDPLSSLSKMCEIQLQQAFQSTYQPFLVQNCASCHGTAHASPDTGLAFHAFMERGTTLIDYQATHSHGGNTLNANDMQPQLDAFKPQWVAAQSEYLECLVQTSGGAGGAKFSLADKVVPNLMGTASNNNWVAAEWDLETESGNSATNGQFQAVFRIESRLQMVSGMPSGINFRNPTLRLKAGSQNIEIKAISIMIDGDKQNLVTTYSGISAIVNSTSNMPLVTNSSAAFAYYPAVTAGTKVGFLFEHIKHTSQNPAPSGPGPVVPITPVPIPEVPVPAGGVKFSQLTSNSSPYRVFARSCTGCHNDNNMSGGLNLTDYDASVLKAAEIQSRMNNAASPMPPTGLLRQNDRDLVKSWIDAGTPN